MVLRVVLADSLCRGTGQSHEQLLGGPACLHSTGATAATGRSGSARRRRHPLPQRTRVLHQAQHVGTILTHTLANIQGLEQAAARHTLFPCRRSVLWQRTASVQLPLVNTSYKHTRGSNVRTYTHTTHTRCRCLGFYSHWALSQLQGCLSLPQIHLQWHYTLQHPADTLPLLLYTHTHTLPSSIKKHWYSSLLSLEVCSFSAFTFPLLLCQHLVCSVSLSHLKFFPCSKKKNIHFPPPNAQQSSFIPHPPLSQLRLTSTSSYLQHKIKFLLFLCPVVAHLSFLQLVGALFVIICCSCFCLSINSSR